MILLLLLMNCVCITAKKYHTQTSTCPSAAAADVIKICLLLFLKPISPSRATLREHIFFWRCVNRLHVLLLLIFLPFYILLLYSPLAYCPFFIA